MDTACNEKSQHIYEVSDLTGAQGFNPARSKHPQTYLVEKRLGMLQVHSVQNINKKNKKNHLQGCIVLS